MEARLARESTGEGRDERDADTHLHVTSVILRGVMPA